MDRISIFLGPSLPSALRPQRAGLQYHPPAQAGDLLLLATTAPHAVLLVDGLFEGARAPWHKEIAVLLSRGFAVWGAASLGALRAAELAPYGMRASGLIAAAYGDGRIAGDDEVAVLHAPARFDHRALTLAQVDVRATLVAAVRARIVSPDEARLVRSLSRGIFFKRRSWPALLVAAAAHLKPQTRVRLAHWLPNGAVAQKAIDTLDAISALAGAAQAPVPADPPPETVFLRRLRSEISAAPRADRPQKSASDPVRETANAVSASE